ncbi:MAG: hypothetical protein B6D61_01730 [Bacteroidetes bacterium 4484_249]|nr:MAG: hypothetical protein B6D61_01730 [Bacteroidetes bacterium 4484_249]
MYFPYLRGKQFELIALRELSSLMSDNKNKISPIIEPVRSSSTFLTTISELAKNDINFNIVVNPSVGDLKNQTKIILDILKNELFNFKNYQIAIIIDNKTDIKKIIEEIKTIDISFSGLSLIHNNSIDSIASLIDSKGSNIVYNIINSQKTSKRYYREFNKDSRVELDDYFDAQQKNADYINSPDSFFSEEHLYYKEDGYVGFSDFLTIGEPYSESGFLPYAIVIHISYTDEKNRIRIKHFVSDSNEDTSDIAGKFAEALEKLIEWVNSQDIHSIALEEFRRLFNAKHFPGLGSIKKLSIMHHIELVLNLI